VSSEAPAASLDGRHLGVGDELDAEVLAEFDDAVDDGADPAFGVVDAHVVVDVAHQVVQRGVFVGEPPRKTRVYCISCWSFGWSK